MAWTGPDLAGPGGLITSVRLRNLPGKCLALIFRKLCSKSPFFKGVQILGF
jgi:hypothetical protein